MSLRTVKTSEGETVKGPEVFLESQRKLRLPGILSVCRCFSSWCRSGVTLFPSHLSAQWEKSHECASLYWVNSWLTLGLVSMPPNKSLVCVSWQNSTLKPLRKQLFVNVWLRLCVRMNPEIYSVCFSLRGKLWSFISFTIKSKHKVCTRETNHTCRNERLNICFLLFSDRFCHHSFI